MLIKQIELNGGTQTREVLDEITISEYSEKMLSGDEFPPVTVFYDGEKYWLADGFHRVKASVVAGFTEIDADIKQGTRRDAILYSVGANDKHGLRRTNKDKRRAVETLLNDDEWIKKADRWIAEKCGVSYTFVQKMRPLSDNGCQIPANRTVERNGKTYEMNTANIGKHGEQKKIDIQEQPQENLIPEQRAFIDEEKTEQKGENNEKENEKSPIIEIDFVEELAGELVKMVEIRMHKLSHRDKKKALSFIIQKLNILMEK